MRIYVLLIFTAIFLSFSTAYFALNLEKKNFAGKEDITQINQIQEGAVKKLSLMTEIDLSAMYPSRDLFQLIQPVATYSKGDLPIDEALLSKNCIKNGEKMTKLYFDKVEIWEDFRCKRISKLPENFFEYSPLIHDNGISYAFLAFLTNREPFYHLDWIKSHLNFFHILELKELPGEGLDGQYKYLARFEQEDLEGLSSGRSTLITKDYFLFRVMKGSNIVYKVYNRTAFENYLEEKSYFLKDYRDDERCFYKDLNVCWEKDSGSIVEILRESSLIIFISSMLVLLLIAIVLYHKIKLQKYEEEKKKHALRVLTHELRTPIANLMLQVESINKRSDLLPGNILEDFLKIEGEVYRLKRLAEKSSAYLQSHESRFLMNLNEKEVESVNHLIQEMLHSYDHKDIIFSPLQVDQAFKTDLYWLNICLRNLVENAFKYGKAPVKVLLSIEGNFLRLDVQDTGECHYETFDDLINSGGKGDHNQGLGLGLIIVQKIVHEMNGRLSYFRAPTTFSIFLRMKE